MTLRVEDLSPSKDWNRLENLLSHAVALASEGGLFSNLYFSPRIFAGQANCQGATRPPNSERGIQYIEEFSLVNLKSMAKSQHFLSH